MKNTTITRIGLGLAGAGLLAATAIGGAGAASAAITTPGTSSATVASTSTAAPASPSSKNVLPRETKSDSSTTSTKSSSVANGVIDGVNLTTKNTTKDTIAVTFNYDGAAGGQANWTWLKPGESTSVYNSTSSGPDVYNSYVYFPSTGTQLRFESKLAAWSADTTITFDGTEYELDRGQSASDIKQGHAITVSRGSNDITLPMTYWIDGMPTVAPDMVLNFTL